MDPVRVHQSAILVDGHNDIPQALLDDGFDLAEDGRGRYDTDLDRLRQGGVTAAFLSIYVDTALADRGEPYVPRARALVGAVVRQAERHAHRMFIATTAADVERAKKEGRFAALLGLEGAHALEGSLDVLRELHAAGVRYVDVARMPGLFKPFAFRSLFEYVAERAYEQAPFPRFMQGRVERLRGSSAARR